MNKQEIIQADQDYFMNVFGPRFPIVLEKGEGVYLYDKEGNKYLDFTAGIAVNALGYNYPEFSEALKEQVSKLIHASNLYYYEIQAKLSKLLISNSYADKIFYSNSGAEANEGAIKLAKKYFKEKGEERYEIITAKNSFHGRTLKTLAATGQEKYHKPYTPIPQGFKYVPYNDLAAIKEAIDDKTAAIMLELIQGEGGVNPATQEYIEGVRELCDQEGILLIFDEIQTGIGRTGSLFAYEEYGIEPDILTLAKALGNGVPIGAFLAKDGVAQAFKPGDHGSTFGGNPLACQAAYTTLSIILNQGVLDNAKEVGSYFYNRLLELKEKYDFIKELRGMGLILGLELDMEAKEIVKKMLDNGILVLTAGKKVLRFLPPLVINIEDVDQVIGVLEEVFSQIN
ncbi:acetylornithine aminotransferase [Orenia metallireducens]|jgi:acetylornithine aminotransferase/acetylornithine/N-succinyldiaminopimelate aminotransferase|uniref:Acetylornithine aminotransferase n=1 Tax=Orenia metallireducens TaxID=1413210 RepID=A0A285FHW1_9FIRM|nr:aspartate aminotransferase family protein [Orenia metallireducens]PRX33561.1 acetylornithine aminotransferase [Orenia metallireducens]SNY10879.1 acetylornithine aminotransferase apoenzyme [Orenia metallireducens]